MIAKNRTILSLFSIDLCPFKCAEKRHKIWVLPNKPSLPARITFIFLTVKCFRKLKTSSFKNKKPHLKIFSHRFTIAISKSGMFNKKYNFSRSATLDQSESPKWRDVIAWRDVIGLELTDVRRGFRGSLIFRSTTHFQGLFWTCFHPMTP